MAHAYSITFDMKNHFTGSGLAIVWSFKKISRLELPCMTAAAMNQLNPIAAPADTQPGGATRNSGNRGRLAKTQNSNAKSTGKAPHSPFVAQARPAPRYASA